MPLLRFTLQDLRLTCAGQRASHAKASTADARRRNSRRSSAKQIERDEQKFSFRNSCGKAANGCTAPKRCFCARVSRARAGDSKKCHSASPAASTGGEPTATEDYCGIQAQIAVTW